MSRIRNLMSRYMTRINNLQLDLLSLRDENDSLANDVRMWQNRARLAEGLLRSRRLAVALPSESESPKLKGTHIFPNP